MSRSVKLRSVNLTGAAAENRARCHIAESAPYLVLLRLDPEQALQLDAGMSAIAGFARSTRCPAAVGLSRRRSRSHRSRREMASTTAQAPANAGALLPSPAVTSPSLHLQVECTGELATLDRRWPSDGFATGWHGLCVVLCVRGQRSQRTMII